MVKAYHYVIILAMALFSLGCGADYHLNPESLMQLEKDLIKKFGEESRYSNIGLSNNKDGLVITVEVTDNPSGYKLEQWQWHAGSWHHVKNISMLVDGGKPEDFLFKLSGEQHFETLTQLLEKSKKEIPTAAKSAVLQYVGIKVDNLIIRHKNGLGYYLSYAPTEGERPINFVYNANGERVLNQ